MHMMGAVPVWGPLGPLWIPRGLLDARRASRRSKRAQRALDSYERRGLLWVPQKGILSVQQNTGSVGTVTPGTSVTTGASAETKGTPAEVFAATSFDAFWVVVWAHSLNLATADSRCCLDLLIGAATENVLIPNLLAGQAASFTTLDTGKIWQFPLYVPGGSRVAIQAASARTSTAFYVGVYLFGGGGVPPFRVGGSVTTHGIGTVPNATAITAGSTGAEGAWTEISASSSRDYFALFPSIQFNDTVMQNRKYTVDIGIGAATEVAIVEGYWYVASSSEQAGGPYPYALPAFGDVPSGTRLVMRVSCDSTPDALEGALHGVS